MEDGVTPAPPQQRYLNLMHVLQGWVMSVGVGWVRAVVGGYSENTSYVFFTDFGKHKVNEGLQSYYSLWPL